MLALYISVKRCLSLLCLFCAPCLYGCMWVATSKRSIMHSYTLAVPAVQTRYRHLMRLLVSIALQQIVAVSSASSSCLHPWHFSFAAFNGCGCLVSEQTFCHTSIQQACVPSLIAMPLLLFALPPSAFCTAPFAFCTAISAFCTATSASWKPHLKLIHTGC